MYIQFSKLRNQTPEEKKLREYKMRLRLATAALEDAKKHEAHKANTDLYAALSHLAEVPELNVNLGSFEDLQFQCALPFSVDACLLVKQKIKELDNLINIM